MDKWARHSSWWQLQTRFHAEILHSVSEKGSWHSNQSDRDVPLDGMIWFLNAHVISRQICLDASWVWRRLGIFVEETAHPFIWPSLLYLTQRCLTLWPAEQSRGLDLSLSVMAVKAWTWQKQHRTVPAECWHGDSLCIYCPALLFLHSLSWKPLLCFVCLLCAGQLERAAI